MIDPEDFLEPEWLEWYRLTPEQRLQATGELWKNFRQLGGSLAPDVDSQSPFWSREDLEEFAAEASSSCGDLLVTSSKDDR